MILKAENLKKELKNGMRGGAGTAEIMHLEHPDRLSNGRLFAQITLPPGAGIGPHIHEGETEYYHIISGTGIVEEQDGSKNVSAGDVVITGGGDSHSIENTGSGPLVFTALILFDQ